MPKIPRAHKQSSVDNLLFLCDAYSLPSEWPPQITRPLRHLYSLIHSSTGTSCGGSGRFVSSSVACMTVNSDEVTLSISSSGIENTLKNLLSGSDRISISAFVSLR